MRENDSFIFTDKIFSEAIRKYYTHSHIHQNLYLNVLQVVKLINK